MVKKIIAKTEELKLKHVVTTYAFLLVVWGFYRALFQFPSDVEELILKPIIWLAPVIYFLYKERLGLSSLGWSGRNLLQSLYLSIGLGALFIIVAYGGNFFKYGRLDFYSFGFTSSTLLGALGVSLITAIVEETVFRGYIFGRLARLMNDELGANVITTLGWAAIHLPVLVLVNDLGASSLVTRLVLTSILGFGSAFLYARTGNITSSVLLHIFWSWPIILFR